MCVSMCRCECGDSDWRLVYRGSRDGFAARDFHRCCDDQGPTLMLVRVSGVSVRVY